MAEARAVKKQLSMQYWASIIADRKSSGLNIDEYSKKNNISRNSYFYWLRQIRENVASSIESTELSLPLSNADTGTLVEHVPSQSRRKLAVISSVPQISVSTDTEETINILVNGAMELDTTEPNSILCGRRKERIKALLFEGDGWLLCYKGTDAMVKVIA